MQNLGFTMAITPIVREWQLQQKDSERMLTRHLQLFNTNPYLSASVIGSVVCLEEEQKDNDTVSDALMIKQSLMGSYAAIGDIFLGSPEAFCRYNCSYFIIYGINACPCCFPVNFYAGSHLDKVKRFY
jgi:mannose/fructose/N-acetylgalactosamine-specific phosphotransferase system component IID